MSKMQAVLIDETPFFSGDTEIENCINVGVGSVVDVTEAYFAADGAMWVCLNTTKDGESYSADVAYNNIIPKLDGVTDKVFTTSS